jgi:hypothetical protein
MGGCLTGSAVDPERRPACLNVIPGLDEVENPGQRSEGGNRWAKPFAPQALFGNGTTVSPACPFAPRTTASIIRASVAWS